MGAVVTRRLYAAVRTHLGACVSVSGVCVCLCVCVCARACARVLRACAGPGGLTQRI